MLTSAEILVESARVLRYLRVKALFGLLEEQIYEYVQFLKHACKVVPVNRNWNFPIREASDALILRAAIVRVKPICLVEGTGTSEFLGSLLNSNSLFAADNVPNQGEMLGAAGWARRPMERLSVLCRLRGRVHR